MEKFVLELQTWHTRLKALREGEELTQTQFAKILGVSKQQLSRFETGRTEPPIKFWEKIAQRYDKLNVAWILFGIEPREKKPSVGSEQLLFFSTDVLEIELQKRIQLIDSLVKKINQALREIQEHNLLTDRLEILNQKLRNEALMMIPKDAPDWLINDIKKKLAIWLK